MCSSTNVITSTDMFSFNRFLSRAFCPSLFSFPLSLCPGGGRTATGTGKNLKICCCRSPSLPQRPASPLIISHNAPCTEASVISGLWENAGFRQTAGCVGGWKQWAYTTSSFSVFLSLFLSLSLPLSLFLSSYRPPLALPSDPRGQHLGPFIPAEWAGGAPVPSRVAGPKCAAVWVLVVVREGQGLTSAHGPVWTISKPPIHPVPSFSSRPLGSTEPGPVPGGLVVWLV